MSASLRSIVQQVTQEELEDLKSQRNSMNDHFNPILKAVEKTSVDPAKALQILYQALTNVPVKDTIDHIFIDDLNSILKDAGEKIKEQIRFTLKKCEYSYLHGSLLREWVEVEKNAEKTRYRTKINQEESIRKRTSQIFTAPSSDEFEAGMFRKFLSDELLSFTQNSEGVSIMKEIRRATRVFFKVSDHSVTPYEVQCCIQGLSTKNLLSLEKQASLSELNENSVALDEVASILTNRLRRLNSWEWPSSCEVVELRRGASYEYEIFVNEDIITALFLHYVGVQWASHLKKQFMKIYESRIFAKVYCHNDAERQIVSKKRELHRSTFLSSLPEKISQHNTSQKSFIKKAVSKLTRKSVSCIPRPPRSDIEFKQAFLHTLCTEIRLHQAIRHDEPLIVVQADLECFGSTVVHDAVLIALEYFGVPKEWLQFFRIFLQPRVSLAENETPLLVLRGVPSSHKLSSLFVETLLFLLDLIVYQKCKGMQIYRISDELWFWSDVTGYVTKAWEKVNTYGKMVGLKMKEDRTGSVAIYSNEALTKLQTTNSILFGPFPLPRKSVCWRYLEIHSNGTFQINQNAVTKVLDEMRVLLDKAECVLEWINVFNKCIETFVRNFGNKQLDQINIALRMIYSGLFGSENGNPVEKLKSQFEKLRAVHMVDAWAYLPLDKGGLGLVNPFIEIMYSHEEYYYVNDDDYYIKLPLNDNELWETIVEENARRYGKVEDPRSFQTDFTVKRKTF